MRAWFRRVAGAVFTGALLLWLGVHVVAGQHVAHAWYDVAMYGSAVLGAVVWISLSGRMGGMLRRGPRLRLVGLAEYWRHADGSRSGDDLQVVYATVRNARDGGGAAAVAVDAEIWIEALTPDGKHVGSAKGNWLDLSAGKPQIVDSKARTIPPTRALHGMEIAGKFSWSSHAWVAGESDPPSLAPGSYRMRASISHASGKSETFKWDLVNPGEGGRLHIEGLVPQPASRADLLASITTASVASAPTGAILPVPLARDDIADASVGIRLDLSDASAAPPVVDATQVRRAIDRAITQLRKQRDLIGEWRTIQLLDADERGEWEAEDRKGLLHHDPRFQAAYRATEDAFNAISLMRDPTAHHRDEALGRIEVAVRELEAAGRILDGTEERPQPAADDLTDSLLTVFQAKRAQALLSSFRDIVEIGETLRAELAAVSEEETVAPDLQKRITAWAARALTWATDAREIISPHEWQSFRGPPTGPLPRYLLMRVITDNLKALSAVRERVEP